MYKKNARWLGNILFALVIAAMITIVFFSVGSKTNKDGVPKVGGYSLLVVLSGSMKPAFNAGDVIIVSTKKVSEYKKGDVITFKDSENEKRIITHRIIGLIKNGNSTAYMTKGDANNVADFKPVSAENIIGQEKFCIPYFGRIIEFSKTSKGFILLVILPGVLIIINELRNISKLITAETKKSEQEAA